MEKERKKQIWLGFFILIGIAIFVYGMFRIGSKSEYFNKTYTIKAVFPDVGGLKKGGMIRFDGLKVGIVKSLKLVDDSTVQVEMQIEEDYKKFITRNAVAVINSDGLMGDRLINISTSKKGGEPLADNDYVRTKMPTSYEKILDGLSESNENVKVITHNLKILTTDLNSKNGTLQSLYKDSIMAGNLRQSFSNLKNASNQVVKVSGSLSQITTQMKNGKGSLGKLLYDTTMALDLANTFDKLNEASGKLNKVSSEMTKTMQQLNNGHGPATQLLKDSALAKDIRQSVINIRDASRSLNENMEAMKHNFLFRGYFRKKDKGN